MRRLRVLPLALAAVMPLTATTAAPAGAACNPGRYPYPGYNWAGLGQAPGVNVSGADAAIWNYAPLVPYGQFSYIWVMLSGPAGQAHTWAQIGNHQVYDGRNTYAVSYTHLRAHETVLDLVC